MCLCIVSFKEFLSKLILKMSIKGTFRENFEILASVLNYGMLI